MKINLLKLNGVQKQENIMNQKDIDLLIWEVVYGNHDITVAHDKIKNEYCKSHNIDIIRIPYWDGNDIEKIISTKLNLQVKDIVSSHVKA